MVVSIIIQARMGSNRLPGKVLLPLGCSTVLGYLVNRIKTLELNKGFNIIVATTSKPEDDAIADFCKLDSISCFRGSENNVLDRFYSCAKKFGTDIVIRLTADCPLLCPDQILRLYNFFQYKKADYVYFDESFPEGICADIFSFDFLQEAWKNSTESYELEHVTPYMHNQKSSRSIFGFSHVPDCSDLRFTVDTSNDLIVVRHVVDCIENIDCKHSKDMHRIISFFRSNNDVLLINKDEIRNSAYNVFKSN